jgi:crotonobetainyl-CoA:carnitine CoA-transferase CaiB-like acyl-CoA transferase
MPKQSHAGDGYANMPLSRYTVLDMTIARAGPTAVRLLADWGANVIRVDPPAVKDRGSFTGGRRGPDEQNLHRNKRGISLDLKKPEALEILKKLIARSDVVVENFRSDVKQRLGLTYEQLKAIKPDIILASISGFGQTGPYAGRAGIDQIMQGMSGLQSFTGEPDGPPIRTGIAIADTTAGMFLGQGILLALLHREHTGEGQWVHTSLMEGMINKLDFQAALYTVRGIVAKRVGNGHATQVPMNAYRCKDGLVNIGASTAKMWSALCEALEAPELTSNPLYTTQALRGENRKQLDVDIHAVTEKFTVAEVVERLGAVGVPAGPIYDIAQTFDDPQVKHLRMTRIAPHAEQGDIPLIRSPINMSRFPYPDKFHHAGPDSGEHTVEVLHEIGYSDEQIAQLKAQGAIEGQFAKLGEI